MAEVSNETREFIRADLSWLADFVRKMWRLTYPQIRQIIHEEVDRTV